MEQGPIKRLHDTLSVQERWHEPWTSGTVKLSGPESTLFYKCKDGSSRHIELSSITDADESALICACDRATFGRGKEDVLDESYRKAWKLDAGNFSWLFNPDSGRFVAELARGLCPWDSMDRGVRVEPYKLNIYGKGGFFKPHKDTPHAQDMFGSLVFVLPFGHQGGNLVLRHRGREFNFDAPSLLGDTSRTLAAYVAFYSDVEHEVLEVVSGHRVTVTFNLFFDPTRASPIVQIPPSKIPENPFITALREQLRDTTFLRSHRYLGFGFEYMYPKRADEYNHHLVRCLKGPDAFLFRVLVELGIKPQLRYLYRSEYGSCNFWVMRRDAIDGRQQNEASHETELNYLLEDEDACIVWAKGKSEEATIESYNSYYRHPWVGAYLTDIDHYRSRVVPVDWVTEPSDNLVGRTVWVELGNEPAHEVYYYAVCILVDVGEAVHQRSD
ncbi:hypothetical protein P691DRAFT_837834 [Macrolepiota fuliginosa MF-IS2]|uniref:Fe2OG dioxygenase domain-containing protein n=1 Tax=Macrolepiota fuliginosa MF-IS2 TaxID=1400762 RepID=A0A9P5X4D4_9AGAR|nr:hypothetical protein P691DRAFT_837834 [Macrolepiota fuliginosa MF-IS2]